MRTVVYVYLEGWFICLKEESITLYGWRSVDIGQQEFMNMVSIHILTKKGDHGYLSENFMGVDFGVIVLKG